MHRGVLRLVLALVIIQLVWGVARIPHAVFGQRLEEIDAYRTEGAVRFHLGPRFGESWQIVEWLLANTPEHCALLWRGEGKGAMELVPGLVWPRLVVREDRIPGQATRAAGRPLATGSPDGEAGTLVVVGLGAGLGLEVR